MPGPIYSLASVSDSFDTFHSCEDVQEAWGCNGNSVQEKSHYVKRNGQRYTIDLRTNPYLNGKTSTVMEEDIPTVEKMEDEQKNGEEVNGKEVTNQVIPERNMTCLKECQEEMEMGENGGGGGEEEEEEGDDLVESINIPVLEARLSVDISSALTRQKIASVQRGRTLSYVDKEDAEESPTRRTKPLSHNQESMELGVPLHNMPPSSEESSPSLPPKTEKNIKVCRNASYHSAMRASSASKTESTKDPVKPIHALKPIHMDTVKPINMNLQNWSSGSEESPGHEPVFISADNIDSGPISALPKLQKNRPLDLPVAANMPRSASFSGGGILSPSMPANSSYRDIYGRRGSISQPSTPVTKRAQPQLVVTHESGSSSSIPIRGSAISRSFRKLFSTPVKTPNPSTSSYPEDYWLDLPDLDSPTPSESRSTSRLRKLSTTLTRKLSTRTKMSNSFTFPTGTNGHNGETMPDSRTLVDYEELMKLFSCSGCRTIMAPPLHQCRKGHLVCNTCRPSLKNVCPVCKQRFTETTNGMMEQVCHLVKFPCRWSNSGCPEFYPPKARLDHEHFCVYRPLHCHHSNRGCQKVLLLRDMQQHLEECDFKDK